MTLPDFIVGGAPRSGTTWLYTLLDRHPGVYMAKPVTPEPKFFLVDGLYAKGLQHYSETWFAGARPGQRVGEKSTDYLESAPAAERLARDLPNVKLIFILREPVARAYSNYLWTKMNGLETEDFAVALSLEEERERQLPERLRFARPWSYFSRGLYADLLTPYFDRFSQEQMLILRFEDIVDRPRELAARVQTFVGVEARPDDANEVGVENPSEKDPTGLADAVRIELSHRYQEPNRRLAGLVASSSTWWPAS